VSIEGLAAELPEWSWPPPSWPLVPPVRAAPAGEWPPVAETPFVWEQAPPNAPPGPLAGMRLAVKDAIALAGRPLRAGSALRAEAPPEPANAPIVDRLVGQGARLVGATRLHELAFGVTGINRFEGTAANPLDRDRIPGGSSSGSAAAVGMGLADVALATDTGGSARVPAALCGVVGYKASRQLPAEGVLPLAPSLDHLGWCTASAADARSVAVALGIAARDHVPDGGGRVRKVGVISEVAEPALQTSFRAALERLMIAGWRVMEIDWPHAELVFAVSTTIMLAEAARVHPVADQKMIGPDVRLRLERGLTVSESAYGAADTLREDLARSFFQLLDRVDVVASPTVPIAPPLLAEAEGQGVPLGAALVRHTRLDNLTGRPAITLPLDGGRGGGLQLTARTDTAVLDTAVAIEGILSQPR
jgi:Asp-tRNA(Asn)/Glu-tRNA(Gln) amidotransferase A subunit family amidase